MKNLTKTILTSSFRRYRCNSRYLGIPNILQILMHSRLHARVSGAVRTLSSSAQLCSNGSNHYDALGITPKATQTDIKSAYYKLSKIYHPDKSKDEQSAKKFRSISEAYEVLGNIKLKKMYDKGLLVGRENTSRMDYKPDSEPTDPTLKFYKSRQNRNIAPTIDGKTPIYNFDAWSKNHYGEVFQKSQYERNFVKKKVEKQMDMKDAERQERVIFLMFILGGLFAAMVINGTANYDFDTTEQKKIEQNEKKDSI